MLTEPLALALIAAVVAATSSLVPLATAIVTYRQRRRDRIEDFARQDLIADKAHQAAIDLIAANRIVAQQNAETQGRLKEIHTLVNSNLTKEMQDRLVAVTAQVFLTKEVIRLNRLNNLEPSPETIRALEQLETTALNLSVTLQERGVATKKVEARGK